MPEFPYTLERAVVIHAKPETVFRFFTDSARWAAWWGAGSTIDAVRGGKVYIRHSNGVETIGEVLDIVPDELHEFADSGARDQHIQGWRFQLSLFANAVADEVYARAADLVDAWFRAWAMREAAEREKVLREFASDAVQYRDRFSLLDGFDDLATHIAAAQRFMPGVEMRRKGDVRHCQGVLADWAAIDRDGKERMSGTNVFVLAPERTSRNKHR